MTDTAAAPVVGQTHYVQRWCREEDIPEKRLAKIGDVDWEWMIACASETLYILSGRRFRSGRSVVRPCSIFSSYGTQSYLYPYSSMSGYGAAWGFAAGWSWTAVGMGWWQNGQDLSEVLLQGPVTRINQVMVDGVSLGGWNPPPTNPNFTLYDGRRLVRNATSSGGSTAASNAWPWNQQLQLPISSPGTFSIDYEWGVPVPEMGKMACAELAIHLALAFTGDNDSKLPARVLSVSTAGLTMAVGDPLTFIRDDLTGLPICDLWLNQENPGRLRRRSAFMAPNTVVGRQQQSGPSYL